MLITCDLPPPAPRSHYRSYIDPVNWGCHAISRCYEDCEICHETTTLNWIKCDVCDHIDIICESDTQKHILRLFNADIKLSLNINKKKYANSHDNTYEYSVRYRVMTIGEIIKLFYYQDNDLLFDDDAILPFIKKSMSIDIEPSKEVIAYVADVGIKHFFTDKRYDAHTYLSSVVVLDNHLIPGKFNLKQSVIDLINYYLYGSYPDRNGRFINVTFDEHRSILEAMRICEDIKTGKGVYVYNKINKGAIGGRYHVKGVTEELVKRYKIERLKDICVKQWTTSGTGCYSSLDILYDHICNIIHMAKDQNIKHKQKKTGKNVSVEDLWRTTHPRGEQKSNVCRCCYTPLTTVKHKESIKDTIIDAIDILNDDDISIDVSNKCLSIGIKNKRIRY